MGSAFRTVTRDRELRSSLENPQTPLSYPAEWLLDMWNGGRTDSGIRVSEMTAFQVSTFLACVDLIAGSIASLPMHPYERTLSEAGRAIHRVAYEHDLYDIINGEPNDEMSSFVLRKAYLAHCLAWGNGYVEVQRDGGNGVVALWPRNPYKTKPYRLVSAMRLDPVAWRPFPVTLAAGTLAYRTTDTIDDEDRSEAGASSGAGRIIPAADMLHVPGLALDGRLGQSTVWLSRQLLGLALATEKFGAKYFANFARPGGMLLMPANIAQADKEKSRQSWQEAQGGENSNRVAVMPPGFDWKPMSNNPEEAQANETRAAVRNQICAILHVPPHMVGDVDKGRANTEQLSQEFISYTLAPWMAAIKQEWKRKLFPNTGIGRTPRNKFYVDFDLSDMLRPDAASREKFYGTGRQWGFLNANDCRGFEKLNPIEGPQGEDYWMPINMTLSSTPLDPTNQDGAGNGKVPKDPLVKAYSRLFRDAMGRILARDKRDLGSFTACFGPVLFAIRDLFHGEATREMRMEAPCETPESDRFIVEYLGGMQKRAADWVPDAADALSAPELDRAIRSIRIAVYRESAAAKAKEPVLVN